MPPGIQSSAEPSTPSVSLNPACMPSNYLAFGNFSPPELEQYLQEYAIENQNDLIGDIEAGISIEEFFPGDVVENCCMQCLADPSCTLWFTESGSDVDVKDCVLVHNYQPSISSPRPVGSSGGSFSAKPTSTATGQCAGVATVTFDNVQTCTTCGAYFTGGVGPCGIMATSSP
jgi:hypothetical protein